MKLIVDEKDKRMLVSNDSPDELHTHNGILMKKDVLKSKNGETVRTHTGKKFIVLEPSFVDLFENIERGPQIITLKDAGIISAYTGISPGFKVIEAGSGSGALTCYLANIVKPSGMIYSYDKRKDFLEIAKRNVSLMKLEKFVDFKNKNTHEGIDEKNVDVIILDMPDPWNSVANAEKSLKAGGFLVCYVPHKEQVAKLLDVCKQTDLKWARTVDVVLEKASKNLNFSPEIKHTAYITFLRKMPFFDY